MAFLFCFVDRASLYIHLKKNQLDAQFIFGIFRQTPVHISGVSIAHHQEVQRMDTTIGTYCFYVCLLSWLGWNNKYQFLYPYGVPPDDGL